MSTRMRFTNSRSVPRGSRARRRLALSLLVMLATLCLTATARAEYVTAGIVRSGAKVGSAHAYVGAANGFATLDAGITDFDPPTPGVRYSTWVQMRYGCNGSGVVRNSEVRTATFWNNTDFYVNGLIAECVTTGGSLEVILFVSRESTGKIVGRARLFSAG